MENLRILIVEDDLVLLKVMAGKLKNAGHDDIETAQTGDMAAKLISERCFDVVITDLILPGTADGIDLLEAARAADHHTEVILITGHGSVDSAVTAMKKGAADYLQKPVNFEELMLRLEKIANVRALVRDTKDLREAMDATETNAGQTIRNLEMTVAELRRQLAEMKKPS